MDETIFSGASLLAMVAWLGLSLAVVTPPGRLRQRLLFVAGRIVPVALCVLYAYLLVSGLNTPSEGGFSSLSSVVTLFSYPGNMLGGWVHYLAFDLLVGRWIIDDTLSKGRYRVPLLLVLPATFMFGPLGLLLYLLVRSIIRPPVR